MQNIYYKIVLKSKSNLDSTKSVCLRLTINRKQKFYFLGIKTVPSNWNENCNKRIKKTDSEHNYKNEIIINCENKTKEIILKYNKLDEVLTFDKFTNEFLKITPHTKDVDFFEFTTEELKTKILKPETVKTYKSEITKLQQFRNKLNFNDITVDFHNSYKKYMIEVLKNKPNTYAKSINKLKMFLDWALVKKVIKSNPLTDVKTKSYEGTRVYLTQSELEILEKLLKSDKLNIEQYETLKYFIFDCYAGGIRFTDLKNITKQNIYKEIIDNQTFYIISFEMSKNGKKNIFPLHAKAIELFDYENLLPTEKIFKIKFRTNVILKQIMKIANIDKSISFHCARHTFATLGLEQGMASDTVQSFLGHSKHKTTMLYAKITQRNKVNEIMKMK